MKNILLVVRPGMSASLLTKHMKDEAQVQGKNVNIVTDCYARARADYAKYDAILLGPEEKHMADKLSDHADGTPVGVIDMKDYGTLNGAHVLNQACHMMA